MSNKRMKMQPTLLYTMFRRNDLPAWRCPNCFNEVLEIVPDSFKTAETSETINCRDELSVCINQRGAGHSSYFKIFSYKI